MVLTRPQGPRWEGWLIPSRRQCPLLRHSLPAGLGNGRRSPAIPFCPQLTVHVKLTCFAWDTRTHPHVLNCTNNVSSRSHTKC